MTYFFYGSLMQRDVLARVLGHRVAAGRIRAAAVKGYRRVWLRDQPYPGLRRAQGESVDGFVVRAVTRAEAARLARYEGPAYRLVPLKVDAEGRKQKALAFVARAGIPVVRKPTRPA